MPANARYNGFAIAGFVLGILSAVLLSVIFSIIGLVQIRGRHQRGKGFAIAGLVLSGCWVLVIVIIVVATAASHSGSVAGATRSGTGAVVQSGKVDIFSTRVGDCVRSLPLALASNASVKNVMLVACTTPHSAQVFAQFNATNAAAYPGAQALINEAARGCRTRVATVDKSKITSTMRFYYIFPEAFSWLIGHRQVTCFVMDPTPDITSSVLSTGG